MNANHNESCGVCHQVHCTCRTTNRDILDGTGNGTARVSMLEAREAAKPPEGYRVREGAEPGAHKYYWVAMDGIELEHRTRPEAIAASQAHADKQRAIGAAEAAKEIESLRVERDQWRRQYSVIAGLQLIAGTPPCPGIWHGAILPGPECTVCGATGQPSKDATIDEAGKA